MYSGQNLTRNELRSLYPSGGRWNLMGFPHAAVPGLNWPFPVKLDLWESKSWDDLRPLFDAMGTERGWREYETNNSSDGLRDTCLVHHFHLDARQSSSKRSCYRWFAFRDPQRFGNVWFNLGGTDASLEVLDSLWTSSVWMARIKELYPPLASHYRIRGVDIEKFPEIPYSKGAVRRIWHKEKGCYPVVRVGNDVYICAGGPGKKLCLPNLTDRWAVFWSEQGIFAEYFGTDPEIMISQIAHASKIADRLGGRGNNPNE